MKSSIRASNISLASHSTKKKDTSNIKKCGEHTFHIQISFQYELYSLIICTNIVHTLSIQRIAKYKKNKRIPRKKTLCNIENKRRGRGGGEL